MKGKWDLKSIVTITVTITMCLAFLSVVTFALLGLIDPAAAIVTAIVQAFVSVIMAVYTFYFSKKKEGENEK